MCGQLSPIPEWALGLTFRKGTIRQGQFLGQKGPWKVCPSQFLARGTPSTDVREEGRQTSATSLKVR
jgi:hypothetical protein